MEIRPFEAADWPQVWPIMREIVQAQETYTYDPTMSEDESRAVWIERPPGLTVVADDGGRVLGTAKMGPNRAGPGAHVATASYMVAAEARGRGVGTALCEFSLAWARGQGFAGMQFNAVAATNRSAIQLYERLGFTTIGTVPGGFEHPEQGFVGLHIMYCPF
ncbi:GNAT family N-acetyltransferase [Actinomycetes bacterium KLBMP 9759]